MGDFPLMTASGTFIINGAERVIVSQIVRSPGVYYDKKTDKTQQLHLRHRPSSPTTARGSSMRRMLNDVFYVRIDKNRKLPATLLPQGSSALTRRTSRTPG